MYSKKKKKNLNKKSIKKMFKSSNALWNPILKKWIEFNINNNYLSKFNLKNSKNKLTFITNRSGFDKRCERLGMVDDSFNTHADFVMYDTFGGIKPKIGKVMNLPRKSLTSMSNKYLMAFEIIKSKNGCIMPKTYLDLEDCINDYKNNTFNKNKRWYLKNIVGVDSNDVERISSIEELIKKWSLKTNPNNYLAQQEIISIPLKYPDIPEGSSETNIKYNSKFVARVYVLITKGPSWYLHKEIYLRCAKYKTPVIGPSFNNAVTDFYCKASDWIYYPKMLNSIKKVIAGISLTFKDVSKIANSEICLESNYNEKCTYCHLLGLDVGIESDFTAKLIEINVYPNFEGNSLPTGKVMDSCFEDMAKLVILPAIIGCKPKNGGWIKIDPIELGYKKYIGIGDNSPYY